MNPPHNPIRLSALCAMVALLMAACQPLDTSVTAPTSSSEAISASSLTADQNRELEHLLKRPSHLSVRTDPSGAQVVDLSSGFHSVVMVEKHPDGSHSVICTDSLQRATEFMAGTSRKRVEYQ